MKTLDEVIKALEMCTDYDAECEGCPYREDNTGGLECEMRNLEEVLHYLKEFQGLSKMWNNKLDELERTKKMCFEFVGSKMIEAEKQGTALICPNCGDEFIILPESNDPLTWDELKQMEGKPVWVESHGSITEFTGWVIVSNFHHDMVHFIFSHYDGDFLTYEMVVPQEQMGEKWQAYRKERE